MVIKDLEASRSSDRRGMSFNVTLKPVYRAEREITEYDFKEKPSKADPETEIKTKPPKNKGKLPKAKVSRAGKITGKYK
jgi:site-specific recombinase XerC